MHVLVTGVAGFIGSHLAEQLCAEGHRVTGIDCFTDYYSRELKQANISRLLSLDSFFFYEHNILEPIPEQWMAPPFDVVYHFAAQAGVRASWGTSFNIYSDYNVLGTQMLLEQCTDMKLKRFIYASSSSVYGDAKSLPLREDNLVHPVSPYGVTKLAGEHLVCLYQKNYGVPGVSLRFFTVYGPRQRPDMAFHRFFKQAMRGEEIQVYGDGGQTRDFTYVNDIVQANISAIDAPPGAVINVGGGSRISLLEALKLIEQITQRKMRLSFTEPQRGDMRHTAADLDRAREYLDYSPSVTLQEGLASQFEWMKRVNLFDET